MNVRIEGFYSAGLWILELFSNARAFCIRVYWLRLGTVVEGRPFTFWFFQKRMIWIYRHWTILFEVESLLPFGRTLTVFLLGKLSTNGIQCFCEFMILGQIFMRNTIGFCIDLPKLFRVRLKMAKIISNYRNTYNRRLNNFVFETLGFYLETS